VTTVAVFLLYAATACPTVYFGDSGELIAAAESLGVAHPPGYPLYTALAKLAIGLPGGEAAWRVNLLSALFGALACGGAAILVRRWTASTICAAGAALGLAVVRDVWAVSTVAEVYTLHLALIVGLLLVADSWARAEDDRQRRRLALVGALVLGVGLAHRPSIVLALPATIVLALPGIDARRSVRASLSLWISAVAIVIAVPLMAYGWMVLRAASDPAVNWGRPADLAAAFNHVTTRGYRFYVLGPAGWLRPEGWLRAGGVLFRGFGFVGLPLAVLGVAGGLRRGGGLRAPAAATLALALAWLAFGLAYGTEDVEVLFLPAALATALAAGLGLGTLRSAWRLPAGAMAVPLVALIAIPLAMNLRASNLRGVTAAADYGRDMLATVPRDGTLFVEGDDAFVLAYLQQVLGERTDVVIYDRNGVMFRDLLDEAGTAPRPGESPLAFRVRRELEWVAQFGDLRAIQFMSWPGYSLPAAWRFEPEGLFYRVVRSSRAPLETRSLWDRYREASVAGAAERTGNPFAGTVAATYPLMRGERALFEGKTDIALREFDRATAIAASETIHNYLGTVFGRMGELDRARREFRRALALKPVSVRAWNNLARAELLSGDVEAAIAALEGSLSIEPDQPEARRLLGEYSRRR